MEPIKSTAHEKGVTALPRAGRRIMDSVDFQDAKNGNPEAVARVVDKIWTEKQTQELAAKLDPNKETIFVSVPSTTGRNRLPDALGEKLARELGGEFAASGFKSETDDAMKAVPVLDRHFSMRNNVLESPEALECLKGKQVVVVEDILTTGGSARQFIHALHKEGVDVTTVAGLMGNPRMDAPPQLVSKLQKTCVTRALT